MRTRDEHLQLLHDGELGDATRREEVERSLDDADRAELSALAGLGAALRNTLEAASRGVDLWSDIAARLPSSAASRATDAAAAPGAGASALPPLRDRAAASPTSDGVAPLARQQPSAAGPAVGGQVIPFRARARRTLTSYRVILPTLAAAAAAVTLWMGTGRGPATNGCDVEALEVRGGTAMVLAVGDPRDATTLIWTEE